MEPDIIRELRNDDVDLVNSLFQEKNEEFIESFALINGKIFRDLARVEDYINKYPSLKDSMIFNLCRIKDTSDKLLRNTAFITSIMGLDDIEEQGRIINNLSLLHQEVDAKIIALQNIKKLQPPPRPTKPTSITQPPPPTSQRRSKGEQLLEQQKTKNNPEE